MGSVAVDMAWVKSAISESEQRAACCSDFFSTEWRFVLADSN
jgi:hypothetical protein